MSLITSLQALEQSSAGDRDIWTCPAPRGAVLAFAKLSLGDFTVIWEERRLEEVDGSAFAGPAAEPSSAPEPKAVSFGGLDAAWVISAEGSQEKSGLPGCQTQLDRVLARVRIPVELKRWVRFFGGSAFTEGRDGSGCWADFGEATFVLPRFLYVDHPAGAQLLVVACRPASGDGPATARGTRAPAAHDAGTSSEASHAERAPCPGDAQDSASVWRQTLLSRAHLCLEALFAEAEGSAAERAVAPGARGPGSLAELPSPGEEPIEVLSRQTSANQTEFGELVQNARASISAGVVSKVVTARRVTLTLSAAPSIHVLLLRLRRDAPGCTRFLLRIRERTFVGATPELLVDKDGLAVRTEALAGTAALTTAVPPEEICQALLASPKDQHEHGYVVSAIRTTLAPLCHAIHVPPAPAIRRLSHLVHLWTPITAQLDHDLPLLSIVGHLHPTPAVGGLPREEALRWIESHEATERGWYSAPFGFVDADGNGQFVVALRSALLHRDRVHLFAGAGIVAESDPVAEFAETELKMGAMERALGIA